MTDGDLLRKYAETGSQEAFAELVSNHADWIFSAALRLVRRRDWAQDVTQAVFLVLAQRAKSLSTSTLNGWLFKVTRYCASNILREENRRARRERQAAIMNTQAREAAEESGWDEIAPMLESTVARLSAGDRDAVLLRFYQQKSMVEVGRALGITESAARKRTERAIEKLRSMMSTHGIVLPAAGAAVTLLTERTTHAAPPGLVQSCVPGAASNAAVNLAQATSRMFLILKVKFAALAMLLLVMIPTAIWLTQRVSTAQSQLTSPAPTPPTLPIAAPPAAVAPPSVSSDDAAIGPFCNSLTQLLISIDFSKLDPDSLTAEQNKLMGDLADPSDLRRAALGRGLTRMRNMLTSVKRDLARAHVTRYYPMVAQMSPSNTPGYFVVPIDANTDIGALDQFFSRSVGANSPDGKSRVYGPKQFPERLFAQMATAQSKPEFAEALASQRDAAIRIVINPDFSRQLAAGISTPKTLGLGDLSAPQWQSMKWCCMSIDAPPNLSAKIVTQCTDRDSADALAKLLINRAAALHDNPPNDPIAAQVAQNFAGSKPVVTGSQVTITLDRETFEPLLVDWISSATSRGPHPVPKAKPATSPEHAPDSGL